VILPSCIPSTGKSTLIEGFVNEMKENKDFSVRAV
jgi:tRNA uridine 5-carbamoylmethylation protein Kti12